MGRLSGGWSGAGGRAGMADLGQWMLHSRVRLSGQKFLYVVWEAGMGLEGGIYVFDVGMGRLRWGLHGYYMFVLWS